MFSLSGAQLDVKWGNGHRKRGTRVEKGSKVVRPGHSYFRGRSCVLTCRYEIVVNPPFPGERTKRSESV